jgi:pimeloyl-ACP methyl ester carboxylesterase
MQPRSRSKRFRGSRFYSLGLILFFAAGTALIPPASAADRYGAAAKAVSHFADFEGSRVHYTDYGRGDFAVVLVHGWSCDESVWQEQAEALARKAQVLTIDLPGHGQSDKPQIAYSPDLFARAVNAVMQDAGVHSAVLVGHSNGTPVVRQFYRLYPEKVCGLVIVDGALRPFGDAAMMEKFIAPLRGRDYELIAGRFIDGMTRPMADQSRREQIKRMMLNTPQHVAVSEMEGMVDPKLWEPDKINVPVLMILAKQPAWSAEYEQFVRELIPSLDYQEWDGVSHFLMMDRPEKFNETVLAFVAKHHSKIR